MSAGQDSIPTVLHIQTAANLHLQSKFLESQLITKSRWRLIWHVLGREDESAVQIAFPWTRDGRKTKERMTKNVMEKNSRELNEGYEKVWAP